MTRRLIGKLKAPELCFIAGAAVGAACVVALLAFVAVAVVAAIIRSITGG